MPTGTHDISSLLAARFQSAADFGFELITDILRQDLAFHNANMLDVISLTSLVTTERQGITGSSVQIVSQEVDEYGAGATKKSLPGSTVAFPLRRFAFPVGWTRRWLSQATASDVATAQIAVRQAHMQEVVRQTKIAIHKPTDSTFVDINVDDVSLSLKAFVNADGDPIPNNPQDGAVFDPDTHTHYKAEATLSAAEALALITNVAQHSVSADMKIAINAADVAAWKALDGFTPYADPRITIFRNTTDPDVPGQRLDIGSTNNMPIGLFGIAEVWVKPWTIANYAFCWDVNSPQSLGFRQEGSTSMQGLQLVQELTLNPLTVQFYEAVFGSSVYTRTNGAVLQFDNATYVDPTGAL